LVEGARRPRLYLELARALVQQQKIVIVIEVPELEQAQAPAPEQKRM
jgi:hypothetical protein